MKLRQAIKMAYKSILGNKGRSFLTMLGIIIGIASVMTIVSVVNGMNQKSLEQFEAMGTNKITVSAYRYDGRDVFQDLYDYCLQLSDYVDGVTPNSSFWTTVVYGAKNSSKMGGGGMYYMGGGVSVGMADGGGSPNTEQPPSLYFGSDQYSVCNNLKISRGRDLSFLDVQNYAQVCVLGAQAAKTFFNYADPVGEVMQVGGLPVTVIGVYAPRGTGEEFSYQDNLIVFPYTASRYLAPDQGGFSEFTVRAKSAEAAVEATSRINGFLGGLINQQNGSYWAESQNQWQKNSNEYTNMISMVLGGIAAISLLVGGIGIMNIMLVTVTERTREIGIRRAIGAERRSIVTQFLIEAAMICGVGGVIGIIVGTFGTLIAGKLLMQMIIWPAMWITLCAFLLSVILGILFGIYPAMKASRLQPVEALRAE